MKSECLSWVTIKKLLLIHCFSPNQGSLLGKCPLLSLHQFFFPYWLTSYTNTLKSHKWNKNPPYHIDTILFLCFTAKFLKKLSILTSSSPSPLILSWTYSNNTFISTTHRNFSSQGHQWFPHCQIQLSILSPHWQHLIQLITFSPPTHFSSFGLSRDITHSWFFSFLTYSPFIISFANVHLYSSL